MSFKVDCETLHAAAGNIQLAYSDSLGREQQLGAEVAADSLPDSLIATHLYRTAQLSADIRGVIMLRVEALSGTLSLCANRYSNSDMDAAMKLESMGDIFPTDR